MRSNSPDQKGVTLERCDSKVFVASIFQQVAAGKGRTKGNLIKLIALQSAIDALDKAYEDEKADMVG